MIQSLFRLAIHGYQWVISPLLGPRCRYFPSCSQYALEAIEQHGALAGLRLAVARLARCHPWGSSGVDPVPDQAPARFLWSNALRPACDCRSPAVHSRPDDSK